MPVEEAIESLVRMIARSNATNVLVISEPDEEVVIQRLTLSDDLAADFTRIARNTVIDIQFDDLELLPYDAGFKLDTHQRFYLEIQEYPEIAQTLEAISQIQQAELFSESDAVIDGLRFYAIAVSARANREAIFLREYGRKRELSRRGGIAAVLGRGTYTKVTDKVFLFDSKIDCFAWDGYLFINNVGSFERIFKFFEQVMAKADETLDAILERIPVFNSGEFRVACKGQPQMVSKLRQVASKPYFERVSLEDLLATIDEYELDVQLEDVDGRPHIMFNPSPKTRWTILKLLDDNYLGSTMTKLKYEVNSKHSLS